MIDLTVRILPDSVLGHKNAELEEWMLEQLVGCLKECFLFTPVIEFDVRVPDERFIAVIQEKFPGASITTRSR